MRIPISVAAIRPGMSEIDVRNAYGKHWKMPNPQNEGWLWSFKTGLNVDIRFTRQRKVGYISFSPWKSQQPVEGLRVGMSLEEAIKVMPGLSQCHPEEDDEKYGFRHLTATLSKGWLLTVSEKAGVLQGSLSIESVEAKYPDAISIQEDIDAIYDAYLPLQKNSAPFADANLKMAVLDALVAGNHIRLGEPGDLAQYIKRKPYDLEKYGYKLLQPAYNFLARLPLGKELFSKVSSINFDSGNMIYPYSYYFWDGEGPEFDVHSLAGLENLPNLKRLDLYGTCVVSDLAQLVTGSAPLNIKELSLDSRNYQNAESLLMLPKLSFLKMHDGGISHTIQRSLKAKGVKIKILR